MTTENSTFPRLELPGHMQDLQSRIAILSGGACGISHEIARILVKHGFRVILINNRETESLTAISNIKKELACSDAALEHQLCDLSNLCQVRSVFSNLCEKLPRLDLCIFSAGIDVQHFKSDVNCVDAYFGMSWLGHFYACNLLWPLLRRTYKLPNTPPSTPAPRVIFEVPEEQAPQCSRLDSSVACGGASATEICEEIYLRSKTTLVLGVRYGLTDRNIRRHSDKIFALAVQPMNDESDHMRRDSGTGGLDVCDKLLDSLEEGPQLRRRSRSILYAATSKEVETECMNGAYLVDAGIRGEESDLAADPSLGPGFWDISVRAIKAMVGKDALVPWDKGL